MFADVGGAILFFLFLFFRAPNVNSILNFIEDHHADFEGNNAFAFLDFAKAHFVELDESTECYG